MHFQFMMHQEITPIIVYLQKEHQKRFGVCVLTYYKMEFLYLKIKFGTRSLRKQIKDLERMDKEFLDLQNYIYQSINTLKDMTSKLIIPISLSNNNALLE